MLGERPPIDAEREAAIEAHAERHAADILRRLGLTWDDLRGRNVLDVGAGDADLGRLSTKHDAHVFSVDIHPENWINRPGPATAGIYKENYAKANARMLPLVDQSIDIAISSGSTPMVTSTKERIRATIEEVRRVLRAGGEFRFSGPLRADALVDAPVPRSASTKEKQALWAEVLRRIGGEEGRRQQSLEFLRTIDPDISEHEILRKDGTVDRIYYILRKEKSEEAT